jgi:Mg-chelatase subunit ChlD
VWRLLLDESAPPGQATEFRETPGEFANRVRDAMAFNRPPQRAEVWGPRDAAIRARDAVRAVGLPCTAHWPDAPYAQPPQIISIGAPRSSQPGEPVEVAVEAHPGEATLKLLLDGAELSHKGGEAVVRSDSPGRHVLEAVLVDADGNELQRSGQVIRVGERPRLLLLGLTDDQARRAVELAPDWVAERMAIESFNEGRFGDTSNRLHVTLTSTEALFRLNPAQAYALSTWVARGGGLLVTGDGAKFVAPQNFVPEARRLLPVVLQQEGKPPPPDPKLEQEKGQAEIAKVSIVFVLDRSGSMDTTVNDKPTLTRWKIAVKGVIESLQYVNGGEGRLSESQNTRAGVLTFTLDQTWIETPRTFEKFDIRILEDKLSKLRTDDKAAEFGYNTDIYAAMREAVNVLKEERSAVKVIVVMTDGADRPANAAEGRHLRDIKRDADAEVINIYAVGIGDGFLGGGEADAARRAMEQLAPDSNYRYIAASGEQAEKAHRIFVDSVQRAFKAYDKKKEDEEKERERLKEEQKKLDDEPPKVDTLAGEFELDLLQAGRTLFGANALPAPAPKAGWYARSIARPSAVVAIGLKAEDDPPALALHALELGRVGFWAVGSDPESEGEVAAWADYPGVFAGTLRWLLPREEPDVRLVGEGTPRGIRLLDPLDGATYLLRRDKDVELSLDDGVLTAASAPGAFQSPRSTMR